MRKRTILEKIIEILKRLIGLYKLRLAKKQELRWKTPEEIRESIMIMASAYRIDIHLAIRVAECESGLNPKIRSRNRDGSLDRGLYQWNDHWHPEIEDSCAFNPECATREFCKAVKKGKLFWWNASKGCWS